MIPRSRTLVWIAVLAMLGAGGCKSTKEKQLAAFYGPTESILEVVAVLVRHVDDDTYRFDPATDFTGRNVYRSSLLRLENLEHIHADSLGTGYMTDVIRFSKARALERLRGYDLAAEHYREVASHGGNLAEVAAEAAPICDELHATRQIGIDLVDPIARAAESSQHPLDYQATVMALDERADRLSALYARVADSHYAYVVREELERVDQTRARYFVAMRYAVPSGHLRAVSELQRLLSRNSPSKLRRRHIIELADYYSLLAREYVAAVPPSNLTFDPPKFQELVDAASQLYQAVATQDGTPEKLEASRRLEAFLAFSLTVDRDRFSQ